MIRNIVLDMGNVLLDFNPEVSLDIYCSSEEEKDSVLRAEYPKNITKHSETASITGTSA